MKKQLFVDSIHHLSNELKGDLEGVSCRIVESIKEAIDVGGKEAIVFEVHFHDTQDTHLIYYEDDVWEDMLDGIIKELTKEARYSNTVIDAYEVLKKLRSK